MKGISQIVALLATCLMFGAPVATAVTVDHDYVTDVRPWPAAILGDAGVSSTGRTLVVWAEGQASRSRATSGQQPVRGAIYAGYLDDTADYWAKVADRVLINDVDIADANGTPVVAWATNGGIFVSEQIDGTWMAPQQLTTGRARAIAAVQPLDGVPTFVAGREVGGRSELVLASRAPSGTWGVTSIARTSRSLTMSNLDAGRITGLARPAPAWWTDRSVAVMAPNAAGVLGMGVWAETGGWRRVSTFGVREGSGGLASIDGDVLAYFGGRRGRNNYQATRRTSVGVGYVSMPYTTRGGLWKLECDVSATGVGRTTDGLVTLGSGGCGTGIGGTLLDGQNVDLMQSVTTGERSYNSIFGYGYGLDKTVVLTEQIPDSWGRGPRDRVLWVATVQ